MALSIISTPEQGTVKLTPALPLGVVPEGEQGRKLPLPPSSSSPKEISEGSVTVTDSGFGHEPDKLSQESQAPSVSPVAKVGSHSACRISSDQSQDSDDNQPSEGPKHSSPPEVHKWSGSPGKEPSSVTGHNPVVMTISASGAKVHSLKDTHHGGKQRSSSSDSGHETSIRDSTKKKKMNKKNKRREFCQQISCSKGCPIRHVSAARLNG